MVLRKLFKVDSCSEDILGYFHLHNLYCGDSDCPLKSSYFLDEDTQLFAKPGLDESPAIQYIELLFKKGFHRFPSSVNLRIQYCYYLFEYAQNRHKTVEQLKFVEDMGNLSLQESFKVFRLNKYIEHEALYGTDESKSFIMMYKKESAISKLKIEMENVSYLINEFWNNMLLQNPELKNLIKMSSLIRDGICEIEVQQQYLEYTNQSDTKILEMLILFWFYVANDRKKANEILERYLFYNLRIKVNSCSKILDNQALEFTNKSLVENEIPIIIMSASSSESGQISNINTAASSMFGYTKSELIRKYID